YQVGHTSPEVGVALRFALAGVCILAGCAWRGAALRFAAAEHRLLALQGVFMYGVSYVCVYHAERFVPSGLVAVGYSASPLLAGLGAAALFGVPIGVRFVLGGLLGLAGVALLFWPEITGPGGGDRGTLGLVFTVGVMTPLLALVVSLLLEGFRPGLTTLCGVLLAVAGNALMLGPAIFAARRLRAAEAAGE